MAASVEDMASVAQLSEDKSATDVGENTNDTTGRISKVSFQPPSDSPALEAPRISDTLQRKSRFVVDNPQAPPKTESTVDIPPVTQSQVRKGRFSVIEPGLSTTSSASINSNTSLSNVSTSIVAQSSPPQNPQSQDSNVY